MIEDQLLCFCVIGDITIFIYTSCVVSCATHLPSPPCNEYHLNAWCRTLVVHKALNQLDEPIAGYLLSLEVFAEVVVPHITCVHAPWISDESRLGILIDLWVHGGPLLCIKRQLKVMGKVKALAEVLLNLLLDWIDYGLLLVRYLLVE